MPVTLVLRKWRQEDHKAPQLHSELRDYPRKHFLKRRNMLQCEQILAFNLNEIKQQKKANIGYFHSNHKIGITKFIDSGVRLEWAENKELLFNGYCISVFRTDGLDS